MDNIDLLLECGFNKPVTRLHACTEDKIEIIQVIALQKVILSPLAEMSDFRCGLSALGVGEALTKHGPLLHPFFCNDVNDTLTSGLF